MEAGSVEHRGQELEHSSHHPPPPCCSAVAGSCGQELEASTGYVHSDMGCGRASSTRENALSIQLPTCGFTPILHIRRLRHTANHPKAGFELRQADVSVLSTILGMHQVLAWVCGALPYPRRSCLLASIWPSASHCGQLGSELWETFACHPSHFVTLPFK